MEFITESEDDRDRETPLFRNHRFWHHFSTSRGSKCEVMEILMIVLFVIGAYVLFICVCYLLIRLLFPKIEVDEDTEGSLVRPRNVDRYASARPLRKQKNLAY